MEAALKLHVGCGSRILPGWTNVDLASAPGVDVACDAIRLTPFDDGCVSILYACHVLEHFPAADVPLALVTWRRVLRPGGIVRIAVPDFPALVKIYERTGDVVSVTGPVVGRAGLLAHHTLWDERALRQALEDAGFVDVRRYDWRETEHAGVDDFAQAYYPHMDRSGIHVSLNMEARRP